MPVCTLKQDIRAMCEVTVTLQWSGLKAQRVIAGNTVVLRSEGLYFSCWMSPLDAFFPPFTSVFALVLAAQILLQDLKDKVRTALCSITPPIVSHLFNL